MWKKIYFNSLNVETETNNAVLIKMPNNSQYKGFVFWHPKKLVRHEGGKGYHLSFSFTDSFEFKLVSYGKGRYNKREILKERTLTANQMLEAFGVQDNVIKSAVEQENESYIEIREPKRLEVEVEVPNELKN